MFWLLFLLLTTQPKEMTVFEVKGDLIIVEDSRGGLYDFYGDGYKVNDKCVVFMDTQDERNPYDDIIKYVLKEN